MPGHLAAPTTAAVHIQDYPPHEAMTECLKAAGLDVQDFEHKSPGKHHIIVPTFNEKQLEILPSEIRQLQRRGIHVSLVRLAGDHPHREVDGFREYTLQECERILQKQLAFEVPAPVVALVTGSALFAARRSQPAELGNRIVSACIGTQPLIIRADDFDTPKVLEVTTGPLI